jgi:lipopolysaccharide cholinephosphotransferase
MSIDQETTIQLRKVMVEILDEFVRICEENNLVYFLTGGTLLGAVRHKGFIPWDDDIDVAMPRNDYDKFLDLFEKNTETGYYVLSERSSINTYWHYRGFIKFCKKGTVFAENRINPKYYTGISIDIWPYDNSVPLFLPIQTKLIVFLKKLYRLKTKEDIPQKRIKLFFSKLICGLLPYQFCKTLLKESFSFFNRFTTRYMSCLISGYGYKRETHKRNTFFPLATVCFEGKYYQAPGKWDIFLNTLYGNYMELPPVEQRGDHNVNYVLFDDKDNNK